jgi:hypothetical protein
MQIDPYASTYKDLVEIIGTLLRELQWRDDLLVKHAASDLGDGYVPTGGDDPGFAALLSDPDVSDVEVGADYLAALAL